MEATPHKTFKAGAIEATVCSNETAKGAYTTVRISRSYKDPSGERKRSSSLRVSDLPRATLVLTKAYEYLTMESSEA